MTRNLIIVRAGPHSLHRDWLAGAIRGSYDLIVSYYGDGASPYALVEENSTCFKGGKWDGIYALLTQRPELVEAYDFFWLPDDDISATSEDVERLFQIARDHELDICQPALSHDSYFSHMVYLQCPHFKLRFTDAVEIMVPCLARSVLAQMLPLFSGTRSGFGLDGLWTRLMPQNDFKAAVLDEIAVRHCRPVGGDLHKSMRATGQASGDEERAALFGRIGSNLDGILIYSAVLQRGRRVSNKFVLLALMLFDLQKAKRNAVQHGYWYHELRRLVVRQLFRSLSLQRLELPQLFPVRGFQNDDF